MARKELIKIGLGYKYAPETFYVSVLQSDGTYKTLDIDMSDYMWGYWFATGQKEKAMAAVKRYLRKRNKKQKGLVTYGFYVKDSKTEYLYCNDYRGVVPEYDIAQKLLFYKSYKKQLYEENCRYYLGSTAILNGRYEVEKVNQEYFAVDITRPIRIRVNTKK